MERLLKVTGIESLTDKNGTKGKKITFTGVAIIGNREVQTNMIGYRNLWPDREVTVGATGEKTIIKGDPTFAIVENAMLFEGQIHRFDTTPYELDGRQVTSWKGVCFVGENPLVVAAKNLKANNAAPKDPETGEAFTLTNSTPAKKTENAGAVPTVTEP